MTPGEFWDQFADRYDTWYERPEVEREDRTIYDQVKRSIKQGRAQSMVDVGCGTGALIDRLDDDLSDLDLLGLDVSPRMISEAVRKHPTKAFLTADMDRRFNLGRTFDLAVCSFSFNYFMRPEIALENLRRLIRPGGWLIVTLMMPKRLMYATCPHRFGLRCPVLFHGRGTFERGGFRVVLDRPFALTKAYNHQAFEDAVALRLPWLANYRILVCERS